MKIFFILLMFIWLTGIFSNILLPPYMSKVFPGIFLHKIYSLVCHQDSARSFFIAGQKLEVCARCTGIYTGGMIFSFFTLMLPRMRPGSKNLLLLSMVPMGTDVILYSAGIYTYSKWIAFTTGLILGSAAILYIFKSIEDYFSEFITGSNVH